MDVDIERLAKLLHESGREAVEKGKIYRNDVPVKPFCEWENLPEEAKEGRGLMALYLIAHKQELLSILGYSGFM